MKEISLLLPEGYKPNKLATVSEGQNTRITNEMEYHFAEMQLIFILLD